MKTVFFLLLRLICYPALAIVAAASVSLIVVTCATWFSQRLADFGLAVMGYTLDTGYPIVLAAGGLIFLLRDIRGRRG